MYPIPRKKLEGPQVFMLKLSVHETIRHWPCGKRDETFLDCNYGLSTDVNIVELNMISCSCLIDEAFAGCCYS